MSDEGHIDGAPVRVIVVDDEEPARLLLREYLADVPDVVIAAECANGFEAVKAITELRPDLVVLDVRMPKLDGFEVLELLDREVAVIFVTAYDEFALRAFEVHAVDYLLKPVARERLLEALERARARIRRVAGTRTGTRTGTGTGTGTATGTAAGSGLLPETAVAREIRRQGRPVDRVLVRDGARVHVIPTEAILYVEAQDDYVAIVTPKERLLKQQTLSELEADLDPRRFVRVHRSFVLNIDCIQRIEPYSKDARVAVVTSGATVPVSRSGYERLRKFL